MTLMQFFQVWGAFFGFCIVMLPFAAWVGALHQRVKDLEEAMKKLEFVGPKGTASDRLLALEIKVDQLVQAGEKNARTLEGMARAVANQTVNPLRHWSPDDTA